MSKKFTLNKADLISIAKGLAINTAGFVLAYFASNVIPNLDLGQWAFLIPVLATLVNVARKFVEGK